MQNAALFEHAYHTAPLHEARILVTGGAGFIGSNITQYLLQHGANRVRVLDNLSNGFLRNLDAFKNHPAFEFIEGDITRPEDCTRACEGMTHLCHQAALGSVPRSIKNPIATHEANTTGFLNILLAARDAGIRRTVYASSSSVYGDSKQSPKQEASTGNPLSPYAVSKLTNELYAGVFHRNYAMDLIGLRYFNVYGPNQDPSGPYAAAIPLFLNALINKQEAVIYGDGEQTRDFTFVENAVQANVLALFTENNTALNKVYNVAVGENITVNRLYHTLATITGGEAQPKHVPERAGDIRNSLADIQLASSQLGYSPRFNLEDGLKITAEWFRKTYTHV